MQRQSLRFVATAIIPTAIAALVATRTGRAEDVFLPGILYNGALALLSFFTIAVRWPLVGFLLGAAIGDPTGWAKDRGLVRMTTKLTAVLAIPYVTRFVIQLPLFLTGQVVLLGIQGDPRLAAPDRGVVRHGPVAVQGPDADGGLGARAASRGSCSRLRLAALSGGYARRGHLCTAIDGSCRGASICARSRSVS